MQKRCCGGLICHSCGSDEWGQGKQGGLEVASFQLHGDESKLGNWGWYLLHAMFFAYKSCIGLYIVSIGDGSWDKG